MELLWNDYFIWRQCNFAVTDYLLYGQLQVSTSVTSFQSQCQSGAFWIAKQLGTLQTDHKSRCDHDYRAPGMRSVQQTMFAISHSRSDIIVLCFSFITLAITHEALFLFLCWNTVRHQPHRRRVVWAPPRLHRAACRCTVPGQGQVSVCPGLRTLSPGMWCASSGGLAQIHHPPHRPYGGTIRWAAWKATGQRKEVVEGKRTSQSSTLKSATSLTGWSQTCSFRCRYK